jgi:integrase
MPATKTPAPRGAIHRLTAREVVAAKAGAHPDGGGLFLNVRPDGRASWSLRYTAPTGKGRELGCGVAHRASIAQAGASLTDARDAADRARRLLRDGIDPLEHKRQQREAAQAAETAAKVERKREALTLARACRRYHEEVVEKKLKLSAKHSAQWLASLENHIGRTPLWSMPIADITPAMLLDALRSIRPHARARNLTDDATLHETVGRVAQRLAKVWREAKLYGHVTGNPIEDIRDKLREDLGSRVRGHHRAADYREAPALMKRIRDMPGTAARALEFAALTASRTSEVLDAPWSEFNLDAGLWIVPPERMKGGEKNGPHTVHLSPRAVEILREQIGQDSRLVFPSAMTLDKPDGERRPMSNMAMLAVLDRLGARDRTTVHGYCRATFSTWANETFAARPDVVEACLAHKEADRIRGAYNRAQFADERRVLLAAWADYLSREPATVTALDSRRRAAGGAA